VTADHLRDRLQSSLGAAYTLGRELGGGGMSRVFVARDEALGRAVVVKVLPPELAQGLSAERFSREIRLAATLQQANIVPVHLAGATADGLPYYTMPYVEGESLRHRLARGPVDVAEAVSILRDVARALAYAHARGIVHRDVKPDNVLLSGGAAVVTDFGIAKAVSASRAPARADPLTQAGVSLGTPAYMAPEQALADPTLDHRADLYSLGVVAYEVLAGTPPFTGGTVQRLVAAHVGAVPAPLAQRRRDVPVALAALVTRLLAKDPAERPASADELIRLLDARTSHAGLAAPAVARAPDRRRLGRLLAGAAVVGLLASTLVWRLGRARPAVPDDPVPAAAAAVPPGSGVATVAVLYFENLSPDSSDAFLASGITEEVISRLGSIERVRVKGRNAVRALSPAVRDDYGALGRTLGVRYVVEGSVRRARRRVRVSVRLLTSENGFRVWGRDYDHAAGDLLVLQEEIARDVAASLAGTLQPGERTRLAATGTRDPVAFEHYLRGNFHLAGRSPAAVRRAIGAYEAAAGRDPGFTPAVARIAYAYAQFLDWGWTFPGLPPDSVLARGLSYADRALTQDPDAADAWLARGYLLSFRHPDSFEGVEEAFRAPSRCVPTMRRHTISTAGCCTSWGGMPTPWTRTSARSRSSRTARVRSGGSGSCTCSRTGTPPRARGSTAARAWTRASTPPTGYAGSPGCGSGTWPGRARTARCRCASSRATRCEGSSSSPWPTPPPATPRGRGCSRRASRRAPGPVRRRCGTRGTSRSRSSARENTARRPRCWRACRRGNAGSRCGWR
jgi:serine/threonine-protein kinase